MCKTNMRFWGDVGIKKWSPFFCFGIGSNIFLHMKTGTFGVHTLLITCVKNCLVSAKYAAQYVHYNNWISAIVTALRELHWKYFIIIAFVFVTEILVLYTNSTTLAKEVPRDECVDYHCIFKCSVSYNWKSTVCKYWHHQYVSLWLGLYGAHHLMINGHSCHLSILNEISSIVSNSLDTTSGSAMNMFHSHCFQMTKLS